MKYEVFAVRDRAANAFMSPFFQFSTGTAIRSFSDAINNNSPENVLAKHPEDYDLYRLGIWDDSTGLFVNEPEMPKMVAVGKDQSLK